jgi:LacI family transcriptional regulator
LGISKKGWECVLQKLITTTDIAKSLGISRGTVSKALNDRANVDEHTKRLVKKAASDLGYRKQIDENETVSSAPAVDTVTLMVRGSRFGDSYWALFIKNFEKEAASRNFRFNITIITNEDEELLRLPGSFIADPPAGIITIGPISKEYYIKIKSCNIPTVFVDTATDVQDSQIFGDTLLMCNKEYVYEMTSHLIKNGHKHFGYITSPSSCRSFQDRWEGFRDALADNGLAVDESLVYGRKSNEQIEEVKDWISSRSKLPTAFVCANDFFATVAKTALSEIGIEVPRDVAMCGFDNDPSISVLCPDLTTVDSHVQYVGSRAMQALFWRISNPDAPYEVIKLTSKVSYRKSTEGYVFKEQK